MSSSTDVKEPMTETVDIPSYPLPKHVVVHPLVLLSVVDHYNRAAKDTKRRVVGVLLGTVGKGGRIEVENCFAVPFEEDERDPNIWFYDHDYQETMKVNAKEIMVGWYSSSPSIKANDLQIHALIRKYCPNPVLVNVNVKPKDVGIPTESYMTTLQLREGKEVYEFVNLPCEIGGIESEVMVVEHLLRDVKDATVSSLSHTIREKVQSLRGLQDKLQNIEDYLKQVEEGKLPFKSDILCQIQLMFNLLPNIHTTQVHEAFNSVVSDNMLSVYLSALTRSVIALDDLVDNKLVYWKE